MKTGIPIKKSVMKHDTVYNRPENKVMVRTRGNEILIICNTESQMDAVVDRMTTNTCKLSGYEEWDDGPDRKWILTFLVVDEAYEFAPELN